MLKVIWNKFHEVIISVYDATNKILTRDSNYIIDLVIWPKFGSSSISMTKVIIISVLYGFDLKNHFFERWFWFKFSNLGLGLVMTLTFYTCVTKGSILKVRKFKGLIPTLREITEKKLVGGVSFCLPHPE